MPKMLSGPLVPTTVAVRPAQVAPAGVDVVVNGTLVEVEEEELVVASSVDVVDAGEEVEVVACGTVLVVGATVDEVVELEVVLVV